jgi:lipoate-protein ligase A
LQSLTARPIDPIELAHLIARGMAERWNINIVEGALTREELALAEELARLKYGCAEWNVRANASRPVLAIDSRDSW